MSRFRIRVNGRIRQAVAEPATPLLHVLRDQFGLTGTKYGCGEGQCGACTVLLDGKAVFACVTPVSAVKDKPVVTIEGLETKGKLHPVQQAFLDAAAFQCGYCTPGMALGAAALLRGTSDPSEQEIRAALEGHLCRCGTYPRIVAAVRLAAQRGRRG